MKRIVLLLIISVGNYFSYSQIILNEFETTGLERIELKNISNQTVDVNSFILCSYPDYNIISNLYLVSGNYLMAPGDLVVLKGHPLGDTDGELAIYLNYNFTNPNAIIDYVEWGSSLHVRSAIAQQAGIWSLGDFVPSPPPNVSLEYDGAGDASSDWYVQMTPTFGLENGILSVPGNEFNASLSIGYSVLNNHIFIASAKQNFPLSDIKLLAVMGKIILQENLSDTYEWKINTGQLKAGIYLVRVRSEDNYLSKKIIVY